MNPKTLIENVRSKCKEMGIPPTTACLLSGAGKNFISELKNGKTPSIERVQLLAEYLGVTTSELLGEKIPPVSKLDTSGLDEVLAKASPEVQENFRLIMQLNPENQKMAWAHVLFLLSKQEKEDKS